MSPSAEVYSRFREPSNFDSDFTSEHTGTIPHDHRSHRFPPKLDDRGDGDGGYDDDDDDDVIYTSSSGRRPYSRPRPQHYADYSDIGSRSRPTSLSHSRTTSSAKRSRKTSASTARDLVRALLHEKLDVDTSTDVQLARAYDIIKEESRRAAEAERAALETSQRLKALALSRASAQKDAFRAQSELRAYKLQLENAQRQLQEANTIVAASDAERARAEQAARKLKNAVEKLRLNDLMRRAREEGRREGLLESRGAVPPTRSNPFSVPITEDDDDDVLPQTPVSNVPLPVPPPDYPPIGYRREPTPTFRRAQTPMSALRGSQGTRTPVPDVIRQSATPPSRRSQTPSHPVLPPASIPNRRPFVYNEFEPVPENRDLHINPVPDHIIIRSPNPVRASSPVPPTPFSQPQPRPVSSQANHPRPTFGSQVHHQPRPQPPRHARHYSIDDPAARASASASRIYSHYSTSTDSSTGEAPAQRPPSRILRHREDLPQQETIVPRPPTAVPGHLPPPTRPSLPNDAVPDSAAAFARARARQGQHPRPASTSSTSTSSPRAFPTPSSIARLQRLPIGDRKWSAESSSSIPGITIEPPSRPESIDSIATGVTLPSHMSPFVDSDTPLPTQGPAHVQAPGRVGAPIQGPPQQHPHAHGSAHPQRPSSRTGFMYRSMSPTTGGTIRGSSAPGPDMRNFEGPSSPQTTPTVNNIGAPGSVNQPFMPPSRPGSVADYFTGDHRRNRNMNGHGHGYRRGHRREPAGISVDNFGAGSIDPNAFRDPGTDSDAEAEFRAPTPRASANPPDMTPFAFGEPRRPPPGTPGTGSLHRRSGTPASMTGSSGGFIPPRPPSSASEGFPGVGSFATGAPNGRGTARGGRNRKTSLMSGGANGPNGRPASRTAFGNTPFMRSSGLNDD